jgi:hypothetical protein
MTRRSGLKRSMPCSDLALLYSDSKVKHSDSDSDSDASDKTQHHHHRQCSPFVNTPRKRSRTTPVNLLVNMRIMDCPATAALEKALALADESCYDFDIDFDKMLLSPRSL